MLDAINHTRSYSARIYVTLFTYTVSARVPPLGVYLVNESPQVTDNSVQAEFQLTRPVYGVRCFLRSQFDRIWQDCKFLLTVYIL